MYAHKCFQQSTQTIPNSTFWASIISIQYSIFLPGWSHIYYLAWRVFFFSVRFIFLLEKLIPSSSVRLSLTSALPRNKDLCLSSPFYLHHIDIRWKVLPSDIISITLDFFAVPFTNLDRLCKAGTTFSTILVMTVTCVAILYKDKHRPSIHFQAYKSRVVRGTPSWPE